MRKRLTLIAVLLVAGTVANVAVAWAPMIGLGIPVAGRRTDTVNADLPPAIRMERSYGPLGVTVRFDLSMEQWWTVQSGAPLRALELQRRHIAAQHTGAFGPSLQLPPSCIAEGFEFPEWIIPKSKTTRRTVPVMPIFPGFAVNTIFYAAMLWALFFAPGSVRRMMRRRRGLCPACAYPIGTSPVCTECGKAVKNAQSGAVV